MSVFDVRLKWLFSLAALLLVFSSGRLVGEENKERPAAKEKKERPAEAAKPGRPAGKEKKDRPAGAAKPVRVLPMLREGDEIRYLGGFAPNGHIQGIATDGRSLYWVFTASVVRTDLNGKVLAKRGLPQHGGDPCFVDGKLFIPLGDRFNQPPKKNAKGPGDRVLVLSPDLKETKFIPVPKFQFGLGGLAFRNGRFYAVGGRPAGKPGNTVYEFDRNFKLLKRHELNVNSESGIQTINFTPGGRCLLGCYGIGNFSVELDGKLRISRRVRPGLPFGAIPLDEWFVLAAKPRYTPERKCAGAIAKVYRLKAAPRPGK